MSPFCRKLFPKWCITAILAVAGQWIVFPGTASAVCGDYVMIRGLPGGDSHRPVPQASGKTNDHGQPVPAPTVPCSGPQCTGEDPYPFGAPVPFLKTIVRHWGMLAVRIQPATSEWRFARFEDDSRSAQV